MARQMTSKELADFLKDECKEIQKYKWDLGIRLHHDPLIDKTLNDISYEWIDKFAITFRKNWQHNHHIE